MVTAPPTPPRPNTASEPEIHEELAKVVPFHHWLAVSQAPEEFRA